MRKAARNQDLCRAPGDIVFVVQGYVVESQSSHPRDVRRRNWSDEWDFTYLTPSCALLEPNCPEENACFNSGRKLRKGEIQKRDPGPKIWEGARKWSELLF